MPFKRIRFVTDSVADIPDDLAEKWNIAVVPCYVNYGGNSYADDGVELVREVFYAEMARMPDHPTTSAMPPEMAYGPIHRAFEQADHVIIITTPARLSGIYNAMRLAAEDLPPDQITLVDSTQLSIGIGWQVLIGAEVAAQTGSVEQTLAAISSVREHLKVYATLESLDSLRKSGRVGWAQASMGTLLQIKPTVEVRDGEVNAAIRTRTFKRALEKMAAKVREAAPIDRAAILHANNPDGAALVRGLLVDVLPEDIMTGVLSPALGTHTGPGSVGVAVLNEGWKNAISARDIS